MTHQYHAQRRLGGHNPHGIGTIPIGTIVYLQDGLRPMGRKRGDWIYRNPWIVEAWLNRDYAKSTPAGFTTVQMAGGHLAQVRSLRDGRRAQVADWLIRASLGDD